MLGPLNNWQFPALPFDKNTSIWLNAQLGAKVHEIFATVVGIVADVTPPAVVEILDGLLTVQDSPEPPVMIMAVGPPNALTCGVP